jgi:hypothetical protein
MDAIGARAADPRTAEILPRVPVTMAPMPASTKTAASALQPHPGHPLTRGVQTWQLRER